MPNKPLHFKTNMLAVYSLFEDLANLCLEVVLQHFDVDISELLRHYGDASPLPESTFGCSVFNVYHYFNTPDITAQNCVQHIDPGLITVLAKSSISEGLEITEGVTGNWRPIERSMRENDVLVLIGETLERVTDHRVKGNLHRVEKSTKPRLNLTFEMRPRLPIYYPWNSPEEQRARALSTTKHAKIQTNEAMSDAYE